MVSKVRAQRSVKVVHVRGVACLPALRVTVGELESDRRLARLSELRRITEMGQAVVNLMIASPPTMFGGGCDDTGV